MKLRTLVIAAVAVALAAPAAGMAQTAGSAAHAKQPVVKKAATKVTHKKPARPKAKPRVLCICILGPFPAPIPMSQEEWEAQYDREMIEHGLEPVYGHTAAAATAPTTGAAAEGDATPV